MGRLALTQGIDDDILYFYRDARLRYSLLVASFILEKQDEQCDTTIPDAIPGSCFRELYRALVLL